MPTVAQKRKSCKKQKLVYDTKTKQCRAAKKRGPKKGSTRVKQQPKKMSHNENSMTGKKAASICNKSKKFWKIYGEYYAKYVMFKDAKKKEDLTEEYQYIFDDEEDIEDIMDYLNFTKEDVKSVFVVLDALHKGKMKKAQELSKEMDTDARETLLGYILNINKSLAEALFK